MEITIRPLANGIEIVRPYPELPIVWQPGDTFEVFLRISDGQYCRIRFDEAVPTVQDADGSAMLTDAGAEAIKPIIVETYLFDPTVLLTKGQHLNMDGDTYVVTGEQGEVVSKGRVCR